MATAATVIVMALTVMVSVMAALTKGAVVIGVTAAMMTAAITTGVIGRLDQPLRRLLSERRFVHLAPTHR